jgi:hypothetical protein
MKGVRMKKITSLVILLSSISLAQSTGLGFTFDFLLHNKYLSRQAGAALIYEFPVTKLPLTIRANMKFYYGKVSSDRFYAYYDYTNFSAGASLNYYPVEYIVKPYIGAGIYYTSNGFIGRSDRSLPREPANDGTYHLIGNVNNSADFEFTLGLMFAAGTSINVIAEITQTINHPADEIIFIDETYRHEVSRSQLNFNSLILKLGLLFRI